MVWDSDRSHRFQLVSIVDVQQSAGEGDDTDDDHHDVGSAVEVHDRVDSDDEECDTDDEGDDPFLDVESVLDRSEDVADTDDYETDREDDHEDVPDQCGEDDD